MGKPKTSKQSRQKLKLKFSFFIPKSIFFMKKIRMIVSAVAVFAVVSGALAFKSANLNAFQCISNVCTLKDQTVDPNGTDIQLGQGAVTTVNIAGQACAGRCDAATNYSLE